MLFFPSGRLRRGQLAWDNFVKLGPPCPNLEEPRSTPLPPVDQLEESSTVEDTAKVKPRPKTAGTADHVTGEHAQTPRVMSSGGSRAPYDEMSPACNTKRPGQNKKGQGTNSSVPTPCTAVQIADVPGGGVMVTGGGRPEYYDEGEEEGEAIKAARHYKVDETGGKSHDQEQSRKPHLQYSRSNISLQLARSCLLADNTGSKAHVTVSLGEGVHVSNELEGGTPPSGETVNFRLSREQQHTYSTDGAVQDAKHVTFNDMQTVTANEALVNRSGDDDPEDQQRSHANKNGLINLQLALKAANRAPPSTHTPSKHDTYNPTYRPPTASSRPSSGHPRHIGQIYARDLSEGRSREARLPTATMRMPAADLLPAVESSLQSMMGARYQRVMSQREDRPLYDSVRPLVNGAVAGEDSLMMTQSGTDLLQMHDRHQTVSYFTQPHYMDDTRDKRITNIMAMDP